MGTLILWAVLTSGITGGVWVAIVLLGNHARLRKEHADIGQQLEARRAELARIEARLSQLEQRLPSGPE
ncbi:MAG: hypothetical protein IT355_18670 [Gemmatimonadaceae bacterium]|nr:hypothetical protein [Gemmatimonadaceae bacterium]